MELLRNWFMIFVRTPSEFLQYNNVRLRTSLFYLLHSSISHNSEFLTYNPIYYCNDAILQKPKPQNHKPTKLFKMDMISNLPPKARQFIFVLGLFVVAKYVFDFLHGIYAHFFRPGKNLVKSYGQWAIVTGATDGIGKGMAFELARKGCNIILISRTPSRLEECKNELLAKHSKVTVETLDIDFSNLDDAAMKRISQMIESKDIGVLVNNVGVSYPFTQYFHELKDSNVTELITLNVNSTTWMTRIVLPGMLQRKRGAIVNIGSAAGVSNSPLLAQYGAAKSYIAMFSRTLDAELRDKGISVQCQVPMFVTTKLAKLKKTSLFVASPSGYARAAVSAIGYESVISPYWSHAIQIWVLTNFPEWLVAKLVKSMHMDIRKKGMKKEAAGANDKKAK
jgi:17beta-estradiol 17-dehydrogenase / very-long-chain 3-oxoacyl-CoA reductase